MSSNWMKLCCVSLFIVAPLALGSPHGATEEGQSDLAPLRDALTFHSSFEGGADADFALGDKRIYSAPSYDEVDKAQPGFDNPNAELVPDQGRFGAALKFHHKNTSALFFRGETNLAYTPEDWSGTVSFWLSLSPSQDLEPGYCDPIQITDTTYNDAAVWVDFTKDNPRQFRLGVFGDLESWNPKKLPSDENPDFMNRVVVVDDPPFKRQEWTHVVITFSGLGSAAGGSAKLYLNGKLQGTTSGIKEPFTWDLSRAQIRIGVNYIGLYDELALFNRPLTDGEVSTLYKLDGGAASLHKK